MSTTAVPHLARGRSENLTPTSFNSSKSGDISNAHISKNDDAICLTYYLHTTTAAQELLLGISSCTAVVAGCVLADSENTMSTQQSSTLEQVLASQFSSPWPIIAPTGQLPQDVWLDADLQNAVVLHLAKNHLPGTNPALMLAIQGRAGEGKTFQIRTICSAAGAFVIPISGGSLSGAAADVVQSIYRFASVVHQTTGAMTAVVIDDFDLSIASAMGHGASLDAQFMTGVLMNLADDPYHCGNAQTHRIPLILSGNNFTFLHGPLTRHGRMTFFEWAPTFDQRKQIVRAMYVGLLVEEDLDGTDSLLWANRHQPLSFFAALKDDLMNPVLLQQMQNQGGIDLVQLSSAMQQSRGSHRLSTLFALAAQRSGTSGSTYL